MQKPKYSLLTKVNGILTKKMGLVDGLIVKDGSHCWMADGSIVTKEVANLLEFHENLKSLTSNQAISLGISDLSPCGIVTKGNEREGFISRTKDYFKLLPIPMIMAFDYDVPDGQEALRLDDVVVKLYGVLPEARGCELLVLGSTSSGVYIDNGLVPEAMNGGCHIYMIVDDGTKIPEIGRAVAIRSWLQGQGHFHLTTNGKLLARSLFDETIYSPERLIFEAAPILGAGLKQLPRAFKYIEGGVLKCL
jgi:hypothetical protein